MEQGVDLAVSNSSDHSYEQAHTIVEKVTVSGEDYVVTWLPPPYQPPRELTSQASGICFTNDREIVLVSGDGQEWVLPGGHPEPNETLAEAFIREVQEEACTTVIDYSYIGCQRIQIRDAVNALRFHYQTRFWAKIALLEFDPKLVSQSEFISTLSWQTTKCAQVLLEAGLKEENRSQSISHRHKLNFSPASS